MALLLAVLLRLHALLLAVHPSLDGRLAELLGKLSLFLSLTSLNVPSESPHHLLASNFTVASRF